MEGLNRILVIVPCSKRKIWIKQPNIGKVAAKDAYIGQYFRLCKQYAEKFSDRWMIFSGKYGVINPNMHIENYDSRLIYKKIEKEFYQKIKKQLEDVLEEYRIIISLCGKDYSKILGDVIGSYRIKLYAPLSGQKIGMRMKKLRDCIVNDMPLL